MAEVGRPRNCSKGHPITQCTCGRPTVMTDDVLLKLEQAFAIDASVEEACSYADIARNTFYEYLKKNPEYKDRIDELRQRPILKARQTIAKSLDDPKHAQWYVERKRRKEFGQNVDLTTDGERINFTLLSEVAKKYATDTVADDSSPEPKKV